MFHLFSKSLKILLNHIVLWEEKSNAVEIRKFFNLTKANKKMLLKSNILPAKTGKINPQFYSRKFRKLKLQNKYTCTQHANSNIALHEDNAESFVEAYMVWSFALDCFGLKQSYKLHIGYLWVPTSINLTSQAHKSPSSFFS